MHGESIWDDPVQFSGIVPGRDQWLVSRRARDATLVTGRTR